MKPAIAATDQASLDKGPDAALPFSITPALNTAELYNSTENERMRQFMDRQRLAGAAGVLPSLYLIWLHWDRMDHATLWLWWSALLLLDWCTVWHSHQYLTRTIQPEARERWRNGQIALRTMSGICWGSAAWWFRADLVGDSDRAIMLVAIACITAIGMLPYRQALVSMVLGVWAIPLVVYSLEDNQHHNRLALGIVVLIGSLNFFVWEASKQLVRGIEQRFEAEALAQALRKAAYKIHELATRDELTGIFNRRQGMDILRQAIDRRSKPPHLRSDVGLMLLDIDHFKHVNDTYGHPAGDEVLRQFSQMLASITRDADTVARIGGEEFMVVLPKTSKNEVLMLGQRICEHVAATPIQWQGATLVITVSIGVTALIDHEKIDPALARADHALYRAKNEGRNRVVAQHEPLAGDASA